MQNLAVIEVLSNVIATEPVPFYFLIVKFVIEGGFEANLGITASECSVNVLDKQKHK